MSDGDGEPRWTLSRVSKRNGETEEGKERGKREGWREEECAVLSTHAALPLRPQRPSFSYVVGFRASLEGM